MTLAALDTVLRAANVGGYAVGGLVVLGWEDARAYVRAAEALGAPVILQAGPGCRAHTPLPVLGAMFRTLAEGASVPVVAHLDHGKTLEECRIALDCGFSGIMFDGSALPLDENIALTAQVAEMSHAAGAGCEGEIGFVGYAEGAPGVGTDPDEAARFARETGVDAMAVSVGNVHLQQTRAAVIDHARIAAIMACTQVPLVIHGGSGVSDADRQLLARETTVAKFNIGTELRMAFGTALRATLAADADVFDRLAILRATEAPVQAAAERVISGLMAGSQAGV
ncbi:MAG: class II fructose-bisphosphate aldolase [Limimaricola sp.]|uniref:class II fructose-bisphosphate aldolase n=1 Tax=Limimaricola sp. TaxID=2211665 RepID=UPI001D43D63E|nr:class II fructose-bisphosphate aldolase [Limimaricola sp.]MBI1416472.1 class II fructose-bisphosphate aldolase [Limimaricola sp.]